MKKQMFISALLFIFSFTSNQVSAQQFQSGIGITGSQNVELTNEVNPQPIPMDYNVNQNNFTFFLPGLPSNGAFVAHWKFGDGFMATNSSNSASHCYNLPGTYTAAVQVRFRGTNRVLRGFCMVRVFAPDGYIDPR